MTYSDQVKRVDVAVRDHLGGVVVTWRGSLGTFQVPAMFDEAFRFVEPNDAQVEQITPALFLRIDELPADLAADLDSDGSIIEIGERTFTVVSRQRDGMGGVRLHLHRADLDG